METHADLTAADFGRFADDGYVVVPKLLGTAEVGRYLEHLETVSGRSRKSTSKPKTGWTAPDGVTQNPEFWDIIFHERLLSIVRGLLGVNICFLQHTDLHVGFSSFNWHRDSVNRSLGSGPDWDETGAPYRIVRVGLYLQSSAAAFRLGLIPGTHRAADVRATRSRAAIEKKSGWLSHLKRLVTGRVPEVPGATWVSAAAGDAVIFDPRVLHTGTPVDGEKFSIFLAYGIPNRHFENHARYYRHARTDLHYKDAPSELVARLEQAGLYFPVRAGEMVNATLPSVLETVAMRTTYKR